MTWAPWSASAHATRRAGPGPRDDKFLSFFILRFFSIVIPAQAGIHCAAGICVAVRRHYLPGPRGQATG